ncbi:M14 family metallopeptidase [Idiomarina sp. HP20-50]|uniref:M14 metallopeptidase family protein n=1 Tax=Idiomarina sp. HP20-50 TaxID=3070813 RepID=UPI00294B813C|nr:M14 family metallopeptidase [Idiomarina sp. HP20-50]MDV6315227.1 M14 family metallopeptidase [Idiomarina sp. HP20-50]
MFTRMLSRMTAAALVFVALPSMAETKDLSYYLPQDVSYNPNITKPKEVLGYQVGDWHARPEQIVNYMKVLAEESDRITLQVTGRTHEQRPLLLLTVTSEENHKNIEDVRERHLAAADPNRDADPDNTPVVMYMGYSIHGDESSGSNAAILFAYYLAAAEGEAVETLLNDSVILLDPAFNPDGLARFAQWANQHRGQNLVADPQHREHVQPFIRGRVNHYWFDMNRDWLLLQHPESRARIANFQKWKPNVLTDYHEMGTNSTFFFQPGIPSRKNPLTPDENVRLTEILAVEHADSLNDIGSLYYTEESFDDFYYGKGSTYPDIQGAVGILFEQASSRGHLQDSVNGEVSFPFTIRNQFVASLSAIYGTHKHKSRFIEFQERAYDESLEAAKDANFDGYLLGDSSDPSRVEGLLNIFEQHGIKAYRIEKDIEQNGTKFSAGSSYYVPLEQPQYGLIQGIFNTRKSFPNNTFYDVSGWTLPLAFNIPFETHRGRIQIADKAWTDIKRNTSALTNAYAYAFSWNDYLAPGLLQELLEQNIHARQSTKPFTVKTEEGRREFSAGAIVIPKAYQEHDWLDVQRRLATAAKEKGIHVTSIETGLTPEGVDLGSRNIKPVEQPSVMMLTGAGVNLYEAGEAWYYLDRHVGIPLSMIDTDRLSRVDLTRYSHIIMVDGSYHTLDKKLGRKIKQWVSEGGTIIGQRGGAEWLSENGLLHTRFIDESVFEKAFSENQMSYKDRDDFYAQQRIAGAIFSMDVDTSHPLFFGFPSEQMPVFKNSVAAMEAPESPFVSVAHYSKQPLMSGYTDERNREILKGKTNIAAHRFGDGQVIGFADNVNFRAYFWGTAKLLSNAIYLGPRIEVYAEKLADKKAADAAAEAH